MPITLRQLESLIRLSQARARAELREWVTEDDALDVVEMMQESLLDAYTNETGEVDFAHHSGSMSLAKQVTTPQLSLSKRQCGSQY
jgi:DNA helicase MCM8